MMDIGTFLPYLLICAVCACLFLAGKGNSRRGEEHGSARWGTASGLCRKYGDTDKVGNKVLTQNVRIGLDSRKHLRNLNILVCGGSGSGKTRSFAKANIMSSNRNSLVILDPKGELVSSTGQLLEAKGYTVKVLDLIHMNRSHCYNPFVYLKDDNDVQRLVTNLFRNTSSKTAKGLDPFWDQAGMMLLSALIFYLKYEACEDEQNFATVLEMIRSGEVREDNDRYRSPLDKLFDDLENKDPDHVALKYYRSYRSGSAKTIKSIQITLLARLEKFNLDSLSGITSVDEMELDLVGERKTAIFAVIPDNDSSFNFVVGMLYTQLFQQLYYRADTMHGGRLPVHVHFLMDEFPNVALPNSFDKLLSTMRSREISVSIIIQNMAQLKDLFEKQWESIVGNCDTYLYLGGNEESTHEYVSKLLGKQTIETSSFGESRGKGGSTSRNRQYMGRPLMTPDEVRMLDNRYALLFIRGERPVKDLKYDILRHPSLYLSSDGGAPPYRYGEDSRSFADICLEKNTKRGGDYPEWKGQLQILTEREIEIMLNYSSIEEE
ncbi:MAG: type IV secretory system conjugative DNA transfer family protein [Oscillospiraceae bacterium]|nr:type IV secretory system conjugative DNA transfer family protein [Oscillospiraceae bacterium]